MIKAVALLLAGLATSAIAFAPSKQSSASVTLNLEPITNTGANFPETFGKAWDPLGLMTSLDDRGVRWFQASEVKHGRIAMMATLGWMSQVSGFHFGGMLSTTDGISFEDVSKVAPFESFSKVPDAGIYQILFIIGAVEGYQEMRQPHFIYGGLPGDLGAARAKDSAMPRLQAVEIKNGRLAMIGMASFFSAVALPGSVPTMPSFFLPH
jgi:hypothetical protein